MQILCDIRKLRTLNNCVNNCVDNSSGCMLKLEHDLDQEEII